MVITEERYRGKLWRTVRAEADARFVVGVDLGQSTDPTALAVVHWTREPLDSWTRRPIPAGVLQTQDVLERFDVRHLARLPLGTPYPAVVQHVADLLSRRPLQGVAELVIDETGVGRAVGDIFDGAGLRPIRVTITAGAEVTEHSTRRFSVPKGVLISTVDARLNTRELRIAAALSEAGALADELKDFRRHVSDAGRATYAARTGAHDDLVLAVAIAVWRASRPVRRAFVTPIQGGY